MKELLEYILKNLVDAKDITVEEKIDGEHIALTVFAPSDYIGLIIGKQGKVIKAIRNLLKVKATLDKKGVSVNVEEKK